MAVVVEVADERHGDAHPGEPLADMRYGLGRLVAIDRDAHDLGAGTGEGCDLRCGRVDIGGVGVGHRLHDDGRAAADGDAADEDLVRGVTG